MHGIASAARHRSVAQFRDTTARCACTARKAGRQILCLAHERNSVSACLHSKESQKRSRVPALKKETVYVEQLPPEIR